MMEPLDIHSNLKSISSRLQSESMRICSKYVQGGYDTEYRYLLDMQDLMARSRDDIKHLSAKVSDIIYHSS